MSIGFLQYTMTDHGYTLQLDAAIIATSFRTTVLLPPSLQKSNYVHIIIASAKHPFNGFRAHI